MKITTFGTRGSLPVSGRQHIRYGGNTTCVRIESAGLPATTILVIDGGSGFLPLVQAAKPEAKSQWVVLQTHYHLDHINGVAISTPLHDTTSQFTIVGPVEDGIGPREAYSRLMAQPFHPVPFAQVEQKIQAIEIDDPARFKVRFNPEKGLSVGEATGKPDAKTPALLVTAFLACHPSRTMMYRFDEIPSGRSCVFMTDDEVRDPIPADLIEFLRGADLLITDGQFSELEYQSGSKRGWGHGTPTYGIELARLSGIKRVALTHHDPMSSDDEVDKLLSEAVAVGAPLGIECTACADGSVFEL